MKPMLPGLPGSGPPVQTAAQATAAVKARAKAAGGAGNRATIELGPGEEVRCKAECKIQNKDSMLFVTNKRLHWISSGRGTDVAVESITQTLVSKPPSYILRVLVAEKPYMFSFFGADKEAQAKALDRVSVALARIRGEVVARAKQSSLAAADTSSAVPAADTAGGDGGEIGAEEAQLRVAVLSNNPVDAYLHSTLVSGDEGVIPDEDFWLVRREKVRQERVAPLRQQKGMRSELLSSLRPDVEHSTRVNFTLTHEIRQHIFREFPSVYALYFEIVGAGPNKISKEAFWARYFKAMYKRRNNAAQSVKNADEKDQFEPMFQKITHPLADKPPDPRLPADRKSWLAELGLSADAVVAAGQGYGLGSMLRVDSDEGLPIAGGPQGQLERRVLMQRLNDHSRRVLESGLAAPASGELSGGLGHTVLTAEVVRAAVAQRDLQSEAPLAVTPLEVDGGTIPYGDDTVSQTRAPVVIGVGTASARQLDLQAALPSAGTARSVFARLDRALEAASGAAVQHELRELTLAARQTLQQAEAKTRELLRHFWMRLREPASEGRSVALARLAKQLSIEGKAASAAAESSSSLLCGLWQHLHGTISRALRRWESDPSHDVVGVVAGAGGKRKRPADDDDDEPVALGAAAAKRRRIEVVVE